MPFAEEFDSQNQPGPRREYIIVDDPIGIEQQNFFRSSTNLHSENFAPSPTSGLHLESDPPRADYE